jgi:hypothetical protein
MACEEDDGGAGSDSTETGELEAALSTTPAARSALHAAALQEGPAKTRPGRGA